jgi:hypothetical protein
MGSEGKFLPDNSKFPKLFDRIIQGIIDQGNKNSSLDIVLDRKGGRHGVLKGQSESFPIYTTQWLKILIKFLQGS